MTALAACLAFAAFPAYAEDSPQQKLQSVEGALRVTREREANLTQEAARLAAEIELLRNQSVSAAQTAQQHETALSDLEAKLATMGADEARKTGELARDKAMQGRLLMALVRLAHDPPEGIALAPNGAPVDLLRGATLLGAAVKPIEDRARHLRQELDALAALRQQIADAWKDYKAEHEALVADQLRIATIIAHKADLQQRAVKDAAAVGRREKQLSARAQDLHELIDKLEAQRRKDEEERTRVAASRTPEPEASEPAEPDTPAKPDDAQPPPKPTEVAAATGLPDPAKPPATKRAPALPFGEAQGRLVVPVSGRVTLRYGEADDVGITSKGLTFATRPQAQVVCPYDGRILFAGPFHGYGQILIIGHGDGYHTLLAGLDRIDGSVGQWLVAGEPVGAMAGGPGRPHLYLELRHNNQPINPLPWLPHRDEKVSG